jgi:hypothetical protein
MTVISGRAIFASTILGATLLLLGSMPLAGQAPAPTAAQPATPAQTAPSPAAEQKANELAATQPPQIQNSDIGFNYSLPSDWELVVPPPTPKVTVPFPDAVGAKKGDACAELVFTAKHGTPASVVVVMALPFACYGQTMKASDLENFGAGAADGLKQTFDVTDPVQGKYTVGNHAMWVERAKGTPKGHPSDSFTFETACTMLDKGAVCWMAMAADAASLQAFEQAQVALEGDSPAALVPASAFLPPNP